MRSSKATIWFILITEQVRPCYSLGTSTTTRSSCAGTAQTETNCTTETTLYRRTSEERLAIRNPITPATTPAISAHRRNNITQKVHLMYHSTCFETAATVTKSIKIAGKFPTTQHTRPTINSMIYLSTAIGLSPGGSSTVHIYTQTVHRTTQNKQYIEQHNNLGE